MESGSDYRPWDELPPDLLGLIFGKLCLREILTVVPTVCKPWSMAVSGPYCWKEIDIEEWSQLSSPEQIDRMLRMLITPSSGSLRKLAVTNLRNDAMFAFIAQHAGPLETLKLVRSSISGSTIEELSWKLSNLTFLDLSYCGNIDARALELVGNKCQRLEGLCRDMHPTLDRAEKAAQEDEANAIATTMPRLKHLEMAYHQLGTNNALKIFSNCTALEYVDLRGCWEVELDAKFFLEKFPKVRVLGPQIIDLYYQMHTSEDDESDDDDEMLDDDELELSDDDDEMLDDDELELYEALI